MTLDDALDELRKSCAEAGGQRAWARKSGVTVAYVSAVLARRRPPSAKILSALGLRRIETRVVTYEWIET